MRSTTPSACSPVVSRGRDRPEKVTDRTSRHEPAALAVGTSPVCAGLFADGGVCQRRGYDPNLVHFPSETTSTKPAATLMAV